MDNTSVLDALAQEIRRVDGNHTLISAAALADALLPFIAGVACLLVAGGYVTQEVTDQARAIAAGMSNAPLPAPAAIPVAAVRECRWTFDTDTLTDTAWDTECGHRHQFTSDGPAENSHTFCAYCGGALIAAEGRA